MWFVSKQNGKVGTLDPRRGKVKVKTVGEEIENSFAVGSDGVYIVSDKRMYRFKAGEERHAEDRLEVRLQELRDRQAEPGRRRLGHDADDHGRRLRRDHRQRRSDERRRLPHAREAEKGEKRKVCEQPVFAKGASATENSMLAAGRSLIVENNYGYQDPFGPNSGAVTEPGFARVDMKKKRQGLQAAVDEPRGPRADRGAEALDQDRPHLHLHAPARRRRPGLLLDRDRLAHRQDRSGCKYAGSGLSFNNNYAGLALGPDGSAYLGVIGGIVKLSDG